MTAGRALAWLLVSLPFPAVTIWSALTTDIPALRYVAWAVGLSQVLILGFCAAVVALKVLVDR